MNTTVIVITSIYLLAVLVTAVVSYIGFKCVDSGLEQEPIYYPQVDGITPTVVRQEPCSDAISRQAALHAIGAEIVGVTQEGRNILDCCQFAIKQLPSVHAEPQMLEDKTLVVTVSDSDKVGRVLVQDDKQGGTLFYKDEPLSVIEDIKAEINRMDGSIYDDVVPRTVVLKIIDRIVSGGKSSMLICPKCGIDVHSDFEYCPRCGAKMEEQA